MQHEKGCGRRNIHGEDAVGSQDTISDESHIFDLADFFKLFGDSTRLRILLALERGEMCVCDISDKLGMSMSAVSHQLRPLKDAKLVTSRRDGKSVYYSLDDHHISEILRVGMIHMLERM